MHFRAQMPVTRRWAYFDHAAVAPLPAPTATTMAAWSTEASEEGDTAWPRWNRQVQQIHHLAAELCGAHADEIGLVPNTTAGINVVAEGYPWRAGDNLVTLANEFPSNQYPWLQLLRRGVETRRVSVDPSGKVDWSRLLAACDQRTRIVSLSWVGFATGWRLDLQEAAERIHQAGALFFLDAIQGLGLFPLNLAETPVDFLAADGHKWMLGPEGAGILYVRRRHLDLLQPTGVGWNSVTHPYDFDRIELELKPSAARYEGGSQNIVGLLALGCSLRLLQSFGLTPFQSPLAERVLALTDLACEELQGVGARIITRRDGQHRSGIVAFQLPGQDLEALRRTCLQAGVALSYRGGCLRISPHAYGNEDDIARLVAELKRAG